MSKSFSGNPRPPRNKHANSPISFLKVRVSQSESNDQLVAELSENWRLDRLATVDRNILRLAIYELRSGTAPVKVVIDEALELAKKFSSAEAPGFLNGILTPRRRPSSPSEWQLDRLARPSISPRLDRIFLKCRRGGSAHG